MNGLINLNTLKGVDTVVLGTTLPRAASTITLDNKNNQLAYSFPAENLTFQISYLIPGVTYFLIFSTTGDAYNITLQSSTYTMRIPNQLMPVFTTTNNRKDMIALTRIGNEVWMSYILNT
jgi:hypothetical protein